MASFSDEIVVRMRFVTPTEDLVKRIDAVGRVFEMMPEDTDAIKSDVISARAVLGTVLLDLCKMAAKLVDVETKLHRGEDAGS